MSRRTAAVDGRGVPQTAAPERQLLQRDDCSLVPGMVVSAVAAAAAGFVVVAGTAVVAVAVGTVAGTVSGAVAGAAACTAGSGS